MRSVQKSWRGTDGLSLTSHVFPAADSASKTLCTTHCTGRTAQSRVHQPSYSTPGPVNTWMGDCLWVGKPSRYVTANDVDSAFYLPWDGKMSISFRAE